MRRRWLVFVAGFVGILPGCGAGAGGTRQADLPRRAFAKKPEPKALGAQPLSAHRFAEVSDVIGPYVGRDGDIALAAWAEANAAAPGAAAGAGAARSLFAAPIDAQGLPGKSVRLASVPADLDLVLVRGFGAASSKALGKPRFAVITTRRADQKTHIEITAVAADGTVLWGPTTLAERPARVLWVGFVVAAQQPLLLWAEQASSAKAGEPATLYSVPFETDSKQLAPQLIAAKACAWQAAAVRDRAAIASVRASGGGCSAGSVALELLGASGKVETSVELGGRAGLDLDLAAGPDSFFLAWSDHQQLEARALTAVVDAQGVIKAAAGPAAPALGEQAVLALAAGSTAQAPAFLIWENVAERPQGTRFFELSALDENGRESGARSRLFYGRVDGSAPELTSFAGGLAALTLAPACRAADDCEGQLPVPTFVALDASLRVKSSEPLLLDALGGRAADLGWGLTCLSTGCFALAAPSHSPAPLFTVPLPLRESRYHAAAEQRAQSGKPRVVSSEVLARASSELAQIAQLDLPGRALVGYVTDFDPTTPWQKLSKPAADGRLEPLRARVAVRAFARDGAKAALADEQVISLRAHSLGGLTLLSDVGAGAKETVALWTGLDKGEPQVFLTLLGEDGKRGQQRMLTRKAGDTSDVTGLALDGGYLIAWVDERSGDAEVYATRVSRTLEKAGPEQRLTTADGAATELSLARVAGRPYAVWADARAAEQPGWADIYGAFLRPNDAARDGTEHRLSSTRSHSFSPHVAELHGQSVIAWLEEAGESSPASVRIATLAASGDISGSVSVVPIEVGAPRGLGLACQEAGCRVIVSVEADGRGELYGFGWRAGATDVRPSRLAGLGGPGAAAVAPLIRNDFVYVADLREGQGLVRRLGIEW